MQTKKVMEEESEIKIEYNETYEQDPLSLHSNVKEDYFETHEEFYDVQYIQYSSKIENVLSNDPQILPLAPEEDLYNPHTSVDKQSINEKNDKTDGITHSNSTQEEYSRSNIEDVITNDPLIPPLASEEDLHNPHTSVDKLSINESNDSSEAIILENNISRNQHSFNKCHICNIKFNKQEDLRNHMKDKHSIEKIHFCHKCKAEFARFECLCIHLEVAHKINASIIYTCLICGYKTVKWSHYDQHQKTHSLYKTHKCSYCNYATNHMPNLRIHELIHEKQSRKKYNCKYFGCHYSANTQCALNSHKLKHEKNYLYCDKCTYKTVYNQSLKKHLDSHSRNTV